MSQYLSKLFSAPPVRDSREFRRVNSLPRRSIITPPDNWQDQWRLAGCENPRCVYHGPLFASQCYALWEAYQRNGLLALMGVGSGKALVTLLLPTVLKAARPVLLVPSSLEGQTHRVYEDLRKHWQLVEPKIIGYGTLQHPKHHDALLQAQPDLLVLDEAHQAASATSARGKRIRHYLKTYPDTKLCALSGTMIRRGIRDWAYLSYAALRDGSPAPRTWKDMEAWGYALDDLGDLPNCDPGVLEQWCGPEENVRQGYCRRVIETPGVVATSAMSCDASIIIHARKPKAPPAIKEALKKLHSLWERPDGEFLESGLDHARCAAQLALGLYLRWTEKPPMEWLKARKAWTSEMRSFTARGKPGIDSPALYEAAVSRGDIKSPSYASWEAIRHTYTPKTEAVWLSDFLVHDAAMWAAEKPGIVWTETPAFGRRVAELAGIPYYGDQPGDDVKLEAEDGTRSVVCSRDSHGTGRNLQRFTRMLFTETPANDEAWEQGIGRSHRAGQDADEIHAWCYSHTEDVRRSFVAARSNSLFVRDSTRSDRRLWAATLEFDVDSW